MTACTTCQGQYIHFCDSIPYFDSKIYIIKFGLLNGNVIISYDFKMNDSNMICFSLSLALLLALEQIEELQIYYRMQFISD